MGAYVALGWRSSALNTGAGLTDALTTASTGSGRVRCGYGSNICCDRDQLLNGLRPFATVATAAEATPSFRDAEADIPNTQIHQEPIISEYHR